MLPRKDTMMHNRKKRLQEVHAHHNRMPIPNEYKALLARYTEITYKWIDPINHMLIWHSQYQKDTPKITARGMMLLSKFHDRVGCCCEIRAYLFALTSMLLMFGFNYPSKVALTKLENLLDTLDNAMLDHMVILERIKKAIISRRKLNLDGCKQPITMEEVENSKDWIREQLFVAFSTHGGKMLNLQYTTPDDPEISK